MPLLAALAQKPATAPATPAVAAQPPNLIVEIAKTAAPVPTLAPYAATVAALGAAIKP